MLCLTYPCLCRPAGGRLPRRIQALQRGRRHVAPGRRGERRQGCVRLTRTGAARSDLRDRRAARRHVAGVLGPHRAPVQALHAGASPQQPTETPARAHTTRHGTASATLTSGSTCSTLSKRSTVAMRKRAGRRRRMRATWRAGTASTVRLLAPIENVLQRAVKLAVEEHASATESYLQAAWGDLNVLRADVHVHSMLSAEHACGTGVNVAHLRCHERTCSVQAAPPLAQDAIRYQPILRLTSWVRRFGAAWRRTTRCGGVWMQCSLTWRPLGKRLRPRPLKLSNREVTAAVRSAACVYQSNAG